MSETRITANQLGFSSVYTYIGDLKDFHEKIESGKLFDFITITNTVHEIETNILPYIIINCIKRLSSIGVVYIYDMEQIRKPELGAITWSRDDFRSIILRVLAALGAGDYRPEVVLWKHQSCSGWSVSIQKQNLNNSYYETDEKVDEVIIATKDEILRILRKRLELCQTQLEEITQEGKATEEEKVRMLYENWALTRAIGKFK